MTFAEDVRRHHERALPSIVIASVSSLSPLRAIIGGSERDCWCRGPYRPSVGDVAVAELVGGQWILTGHVSKVALPHVGTVTATSVSGKPGYIAVSADGVTHHVQAVGTYTVGQVVGLEWGASTARVTGVVADPVAGDAPEASTPAESDSGEATFPAVDAGTWRGGWRTDTSHVIQGDYGGYGKNFGSWWYGSIDQRIPAGAEVVEASIVLPRLNAAGASGPVPVHLYHHTSATRPAGDVVRDSGPYTVTGPAWGETVTVPISLALAQALADNGGGISIRVTGTSGTDPDYIRLLGRADAPESGQLHMKWRTPDD